jgi:hypothetical protein
MPRAVQMARLMACGRWQSVPLQLVSLPHNRRRPEMERVVDTTVIVVVLAMIAFMAWAVFVR